MGQTHTHTSAPTAAPVPLLDLQRQYAELEPEFAAAIKQVCDSGKFVLGPEVERCEKLTAEYCGAKHAIGCASGSDALLLALMALGVGRGHEVIVPSFTFFATAGSVWQSGAMPVFADCEPDTYNIDPNWIASLITPRTRAIIPVHLYGQSADMDAIRRLAEKHDLHVIEDAAQAIGAEYRGKRAGVLGKIGCFSFYPTKNLGCFGDGGMLTTDDDDMAAKLRMLRGHGMQPRYYHRIVGINSRLDSIQATVLNVKFPHLERWTNMRAANAARYFEMFAASGLDKVVGLPKTMPHRRHVWNQFVIRVPNGQRNQLREYLASKQVGSEVYYPVGLHQQECFQRLIPAGPPLPETERAIQEVLALPIFPELTVAEQQRVVSTIGEFYATAAKSGDATRRAA
ncbi:MAG TPA: DegT/DnrJ/EryC1/StrS family aminotransferase [Pirellulales bacterium]